MLAHSEKSPHSGDVGLAIGSKTNKKNKTHVCILTGAIAALCFAISRLLFVWASRLNRKCIKNVRRLKITQIIPREEALPSQSAQPLGRGAAALHTDRKHWNETRSRQSHFPHDNLRPLK